MFVMQSRHYFFLRIRVEHHLTKSFDKENFEYKCKNALKLGVLRGKKKMKTTLNNSEKFMYNSYMNCTEIYISVQQQAQIKKKKKEKKKKKMVD